MIFGGVKTVIEDSVLINRGPCDFLERMASKGKCEDSEKCRLLGIWNENLLDRKNT